MLNYLVVDSETSVPANSIVIDSNKLPTNGTWLRIDHHTDNGWTNLDSVMSSLDVLKSAKPDNIVTDYLDPDAVISAAIITLLYQTSDIKFSNIVKSLWQILYSASFWSDYSAKCPWISNQNNVIGNKVHLWLRDQIERLIGEDRALSQNERARNQTTAFSLIVEKFVTLIKPGYLSRKIICFDEELFLKKLSADLHKFVRNDLSNNSYGALHIIGGARRIIPSAYYSLFESSVVVRCIQAESETNSIKQFLIGVNTMKDNWVNLNLLLLADILKASERKWSFGGRRYVIGLNDDEQRKCTIEEVMNSINNISINSIQSSLTSWSFSGGNYGF